MTKCLVTVSVLMRWAGGVNTDSYDAKNCPGKKLNDGLYLWTALSLSSGCHLSQQPVAVFGLKDLEPATRNTDASC